MTLQTSSRASARLLLLGVALGATALLSTNAPAVPHSELMEDRAALGVQIRGSQNPAALLVERSGIHRELGDWDAALVDLDRALEFGAGIVEVSLGRAAVRMSQADFARAEAEASVALKADPKNGDAQALRGRARMARGLYQLAADDFGGAARLVARRPLDLVCAQAEAFAELPGDGREQALAVIEAEIASRGPASSLLLIAYEHEFALGRFAAALDRLEALRAQGWSEAHYGMARGDVLQASGEPNAAIAAWKMGQESLERMPTRRRTTRAAAQLRSDLMSRLGENQ